MDIKKAYSSYNARRYEEYRRQWEWQKHDIFDENIRPRDKVMVRDEHWEEGKLIPAILKDMEVNRIAYPMEQDIVQKHTTFTVGREPLLDCFTTTPTEAKMLQLLTEVSHDTKLKYHNRRVVSSWFSECMVAEYWWVDRDTKELRVELWSPFRGDKLIPEKDGTGKLIGFYRFYSTRDPQGREVEWASYITPTDVQGFRLERGEWVPVADKSFSHGFSKLPIIYMDRPEPLCHKISTIRDRIEKVWSNSADCNDYHYAPKQIISGEIEVVNSNPTGRNKTIKLQNGGDIKMLTWNQSSEMVTTEVEKLEETAYQIMNTPRLSPKEISSTGATSGEAFKYVFAGIRLAVESHEEQVGEYLQRRINFLLHALATLHPEVKEAEGMHISPQLVPYSIE